MSIKQCHELEAPDKGDVNFADRPNEEDLKKIRTRKAEMPMLPVTLKDGSKRELWCTFGPEQIDIDVCSPTGKTYRHNLIRTPLQAFLHLGMWALCQSKFSLTVQKKE